MNPRQLAYTMEERLQLAARLRDHDPQDRRRVLEEIYDWFLKNLDFAVSHVFGP